MRHDKCNVYGDDQSFQSNSQRDSSTGARLSLVQTSKFSSVIGQTQLHYFQKTTLINWWLRSQVLVTVGTVQKLFESSKQTDKINQKHNNPIQFNYKE